MATEQPGINLDTLREILAGAESMVRYYGETEKKVAQNAALIAAGLEPIHKPASLEWDREQAAKKAREAECLRAVIAYFGGDAQAEAA